MSTKSSPIVGVLLMTYGSATTAEHVRPFLKKAYGKEPSDATVDLFEERYRVIGRSPLIDQTQTQARLLEQALHKAGHTHYVVEAGMRHSSPTIEEAVKTLLARGAESFCGIILSPQFSSLIMQGYTDAFSQALAAAAVDPSRGSIVPPWPDQEHFITCITDAIARVFAEKRQEGKAVPPIIFTTHSLPKRVVDQDASYLEQLQKTITALWERQSPTLEWYQGYQSAGHTPEEWLKPDLVDLLHLVKEKGHEEVLIVPIQFLSDHLEVLYDLDVAARAQCEALGIGYHRTDTPGTDPHFIHALMTITLTHTGA